MYNNNATAAAVTLGKWEPEPPIVRVATLKGPKRSAPYKCPYLFSIEVYVEEPLLEWHNQVNGRLFARQCVYTVSLCWEVELIMEFIQIQATAAQQVLKTLSP